MTTNFNPPAGWSTPWNAVVVNGGANSVYLGNRWFIAPWHVGGNNVYVPGVGTLYRDPGTPVIQLTDPTNASPGVLSDLIMFRVSGDPGLVAPTLATTSPRLGDSLTLIATGSLRSSSYVYYSVDANWNWTAVTSRDPYNYFGYAVSADRGKLWGTNNITGATQSTWLQGLGFTASNPLFKTDFQQTPNEAAAFSGDSGGGVFNSAGQLVGILEAANVEGVNNAPSNTVIFGTYYSYITDLTPYIPAINLIVGRPSTIPEPLPLGICPIALLPRARRSR